MSPGRATVSGTVLTGRGGRVIFVGSPVHSCQDQSSRTIRDGRSRRASSRRWGILLPQDEELGNPDATSLPAAQYFSLLLYRADLSKELNILSKKSRPVNTMELISLRKWTWTQSWAGIINKEIAQVEEELVAEESGWSRMGMGSMSTKSCRARRGRARC